MATKEIRCKATNIKGTVMCINTNTNQKKNNLNSRYFYHYSIYSAMKVTFVYKALEVASLETRKTIY